MKKYEFESFFKSLLLFWISLGLFLAIIIYLDYRDAVKTMEEKIFTQMRICSFDLNCPDFKINFTIKGDKKPSVLYRVDGGLGSYFPMPNSKEFYLSILYPAVKYNIKVDAIRKEHILHFVILFLILGIISALFSLYALYPMRRAFMTIEEFIKDILHDFNTPISSIVLNSSLLEKDKKNRERVDRILKSSQTILSLQENLKSYLKDIQSKREEFDILDIIIEKKQTLQKIYPDIAWHIDKQSLKLYTHKDAFSRIITNLLSNATKYNKKGGSVTIKIDTKGKVLTISDTGKGFENPKRAFKRFYTEDERGLGIGLHIVKKLCDELKIGIELKSKIGEGSTFTLKLAKVTKR